jgi:hypothetical protein
MEHLIQHLYSYFSGMDSHIQILSAAIFGVGALAATVGVIISLFLRRLRQLRQTASVGSMTTNGKIRVYHGTRLPMSVVVSQGISPLSSEKRTELFELLGKSFESIGIYDLKRDWLDGMLFELKDGVYVSGDIKPAKIFALAAPSFVSDAIIAQLKKLKLDDNTLDYTLLSLLDKIGQPKVIECVLPLDRFLSGSGGYGSVVDKITPEDIIQIHVISYREPRRTSVQVVSNLLNDALHRWGGIENKQLGGKANV